VLAVYRLSTHYASIRRGVGDLKKLVFKIDYAGKILSGEKTATVRLHANFREGDIVEVYVGHARVGRAVIKKIVRKKLSELSDEDVKKDGFRSKEEFLRDFARIYGKQIVEKDPEVYIVEFQLL